MSILEAFLSQLSENNNWVSHGGGHKWKKDAEQANFEMFCSRSFVMFVNNYMCTCTHVHQESMSIRWSQGLKDQKPMLVLVIYSGCYLFLLFQFLSLSPSLSLFPSLSISTCDAISDLLIRLPVTAVYAPGRTESCWLSGRIVPPVKNRRWRD